MISAFSAAVRAAMVATQTGTNWMLPFLNNVVPAPDLGSVSFQLANDTTTLTKGDGTTPQENLTFNTTGTNDAAEQIQTTTAGSVLRKGSSAASYPLTVYGYVLASDSLGATLKGAFRYDEPIVLSASGQIIDMPMEIPINNNCGGVGNI